MIAALGLVWLITDPAAAAEELQPSGGGDRVIQSVEADETVDGWEVLIRFSTPLRYVRHTPKGRTALAVIEMQPLGLERAEGGPTLGSEVVRPFQGRSGPPVLEVSTSGEESGGRVVEIRFRGETEYDVSQAGDLRILRVSLPRLGDPAQEARAVALLAAGAEALAASDPDRAARLYTKVLSLNAPKTHPEAQEMLGLARERGGQRSHAYAEYAAFLERFPEHENASRVRQRMQSIATAGESAVQRRVATVDKREIDFDFGGRLSSYYSRAEFFLGDGLGSDVADSSWINDLYLDASLGTEDFEIEARASGRARLDFEDGPVGSDSRLTGLMIEAEQRTGGWWGNLGRQRGGGGITGRFDGGRVGYRANDSLDFHILGGFPLSSYSSNSLNTDLFQVGAVAQVLEIASLVDVEFYSNYQSEDALIYRAALGGQLRHLRRGRSIVASFDYDVYFNAVNLATLLADVEVMDGLSLNTLLEYRKSPILTLGNALIGMPTGSITDLHDAFSAGQMKDLAEDRTADAATLTFGARYALNERFDLSGNWTASRLSGTSASGGVLGTESTGFEYTYYAQIAGRALLMDRGMSTLGIRVFDGSTNDTYMLQLNGRYPILPNMRINPIIRVEYVDADDDSVRWVPRLRLDYTWRSLVFDLDLAFEMIQGVGSSVRPDEYGYSMLVGLRYDF